ncbi:MAG: outer membrane beta-barrel protein [Betaproteobacteria bacterium]|nr:outer membrane beta-barrel protein [Betaproteobacteria bacterium]
MKTFIKFAVALVALTATSVFAQPYIGASAGRVDHKQNRADWQPAVGSTAYEDIDTGFKLFGGYKFNEYFGVEGGYNYLGQYTASPTSGASVGKAVIKTDAWNVFAVGTVPLPANFSLFGKLGVSSNYSKMNFSSNGGAFATNDAGTARKTSVAWGLGGAYAFNKNVSVRIEYEDFGKAGETNNAFTTATKTSDSKPRLISAGVVYTF